MLICPNKNLKEWKDLVASVGENRAMLMWYESEGKVGFTLSAQTTILDNLSKVNNWFKQMKDTDAFWSKLQKDLQIPKDQISLLKESNGKTIEEKLTNFVANYSYTVEINTAKTKEKNIKESRDGVNFNIDGDIYRSEFTGEVDFDEFGGSPVIKYTKNGKVITEEEFLKQRDKATGKPSQYYSNLTVPGGTNYTENEISTPLIIPSIKGHAQFATDNGIGWFRSDDATTGDKNKNYGEYEDDVLSSIYEGFQEQGLNISFEEFKKEYKKQNSGKLLDTKTRRILEVQSDLFQKGRDNEELTHFEQVGNHPDFKNIKGLDDPLWSKLENEVYGKRENQFLQLLNKNNNWVTFFIKSIIQDTAKQTITEVQESDVEAKVKELEKEGLLEIDCKGKLKAEDGISTLFEKGGRWEIVTDFKNAPTHKSGGKDISIQGKKVEVEKNELKIENDFGDVAVIPSKYRIEVQDAIKSNCHSCIDGIVESLPKMKDYAGNGTVFPFFGRYKRFKNSLPDNLKNTSEDDYAMRYYWKHSNKPKSFDEAINREQPMFTMEDDGYYHAPSVEPTTLRFLKPKTHPTLQYELDWYNSDNPDAIDFRNKYDLDTSDKFYRYVPKKLGQ